MMQAIIKKGSKNHHLIACFDGEDKIELYKDIEEQHWVGTYDLMDKRVTYFVTKNSPKSPDIKRYSLTIPKIELICKEFVAERVDW